MNKSSLKDQNHREMHIVLCMIVKNEEKNILRCLKSVISCLDLSGVCICDTGSSDKTKELASEFLTLMNIKYKLLDKEWKNFGYNRTEAFNETKIFASSLQFNDVYVLLIDADMSLFSSMKKEQLSSFLNQLKEDDYELTYINENVTYRKPTLVNAKKNWISVGKTHEYWILDDAVCSCLFFPHLTLYEHNDGGCRGDKYTRDLRILEEESLEEGSLPQARTQFYLAQTYVSLKNYEKAIECYKKRIEIGGWEEEVWYSSFMIAKCMQELEERFSIEKIRDAYLLAYQRRPSRMEPLFYLATFLLSKGKNYEAFLYVSSAIEIPFPFPDILFLEYKVYGYMINVLFCILSNDYIKSIKKSFSAISSEKDKKKAKNLQEKIIITAKELIFDLGIRGGAREDVIDSLRDNSYELLDAYNVKTFETPKHEEIIFSSIIKVHDGYAYLIQRPNMIIVYLLDEQFQLVKCLTALRLSSLICQEPTLIQLNDKILVHYFDIETKVHRFSDFDGKEAIPNVETDGIVFTGKDAKVQSRTLSLWEDLSTNNKETTTSKFDVSSLSLKFGPLIVNDSEIWFCKCYENYVVISIEKNRIVKMSIPFKISSFDLSSCTINKNGTIVLTQKDKLLSIDIRFILKLLL